MVIVLTVSWPSVVPILAFAQESANDALEKCMQQSAVSGAIGGAIVGGIIGALLGGDNNRGRGAAIGAAGGGAIGGIVSWRNSWKSCSAKFAVAKSLQTDDYKKTAERVGYVGQGVLLKIEAAEMPSPAQGNTVLPVNLKFVLLTPDARSSKVIITRTLACLNEQQQLEEIPIPPEVITVTAGTFVSGGKILLPKISPELGNQECQMTVRVQAEGLQDERAGRLTITPG